MKLINMRAIVLNSYGSTSNFEKAEIPLPKISPNQVLVRVVASSVNPVDCKIKKGLLSVGPALPAVLHGDMSGEIVQIGESVTEFKKGDLIYGCVGGFGDLPGVLSEFVAVDSQLIALIPQNLTMAEAASIPLVGITAWNALVDRANVRKGQRVLVHGAAGGVGHIGLQLAKALAAEVHTTASTDAKIKFGKEIGADVLINYKKEKVEDYISTHTNGEGYDVVFDTAGGECLDNSFIAAKIGGSVVSIAARAKHDLSPVHIKSLTLHVVFMLLPLLRGMGRAHHGNILRKLGELIEDGLIQPKLHNRKFNFEEVEDAHRCFEEDEIMGKISLVSNW
jgi:NADPH2:quinone reductase